MARTSTPKDRCGEGRSGTGRRPSSGPAWSKGAKGGRDASCATRAEGPERFRPRELVSGATRPAVDKKIHRPRGRRSAKGDERTSECEIRREDGIIGSKLSKSELNESVVGALAAEDVEPSGEGCQMLS